MKTNIYIITGLISFFTLLPIARAEMRLGDLFNGAKNMLSTEQPEDTQVPESKIIKGLKSALEIGTEKAVNNVSIQNGFYENSDIRIELPDMVKKLDPFIRTAGYGEQLDDFILSMNRSAELAAPEAKKIFLKSITDMTINDAKKILAGRDNEATLYFKEKTYNKLYSTFKPIVRKRMSQVGVAQKYQALNSKIETIPFAEKFNFDPDSYITNKGLDGLFLMLAKEEEKIRHDPAARVTDLLKTVFTGK